MAAGGDSQSTCTIRAENRRCIYVFDTICIRISGFEVRRLERSKVQVEAREGVISKGNDVRGIVRAEKKPRAWRGPA